MHIHGRRAAAIGLNAIRIDVGSVKENDAGNRERRAVFLVPETNTRFKSYASVKVDYLSRGRRRKKYLKKIKRYLPRDGRASFV